MKKIFLCLIIISNLLLADFTRSSDGIVTDNITGLQWQDDENPLLKTWQEAIDYCENLTLGGRDDWRLPNINELNSILDDTTYNSAISTTFTHTSSEAYWTSTTIFCYSQDRAWIIDFFSGIQTNDDKAENHYIRCVRAGQ